MYKNEKKNDREYRENGALYIYIYIYIIHSICLQEKQSMKMIFL